MAVSKVTYYCGDIELRHIWPETNARFYAIGGERNNANRWDSFKRAVGAPVEDPRAVYPVTRKVEYKRNPSLHKCGSRCQAAKGPSCECSCGGKNHGINA